MFDRKVAETRADALASSTRASRCFDSPRPAAACLSCLSRSPAPRHPGGQDESTQASARRISLTCPHCSLQLFRSREGVVSVKPLADKPGGQQVQKAGRISPEGTEHVVFIPVAGRICHDLKNKQPTHTPCYCASTQPPAKAASADKVCPFFFFINK